MSNEAYKSFEAANQQINRGGKMDHQELRDDFLKLEKVVADQD
jgi:hypothetical protein